MGKIIIPLDGFKSKKDLMAVVSEIAELEQSLGRKDLIWGFKVNDSLIEYGVSIVKDLKAVGFKVFADPKLKDIPNTMNNSLNRLIEAGADIITVHCASIYKPKDIIQASKIAGVTILTSMTEEQCYSIYDTNIDIMVNYFHDLAVSFKYEYLVCSAQDLEYIASESKIKKICPGIRLADGSQDDQVRIMTPGKAIKAGADLLVVGRPILNAKNKAEVIQRINTEIQCALMELAEETIN